MPGAVLIPIKSFDLAKGRLSEAVDPARRAELAEQMAATVIAAARHVPVWVVCGDDGVADFARANGASVIWREPQGLNRAIEEGTQHLDALGFTRAIVAHADLPLASDLTFLDVDDDRVVLVPDRRNDGSNVLSIPLGKGFTFHYGPGSAAAHRAEAERLGLTIEVINDERLAWDVDVPDDLSVLDDFDLTGPTSPTADRLDPTTEPEPPSAPEIPSSPEPSSPPEPPSAGAPA